MNQVTTLPMQSPRCVFVVHGRNDQAYRAMVTFLRALQLEPLEWPAVERLGAAASPETYAVVARGIGEAQCAVVLFTGDDAAQLRPDYGPEAPGYQPRPNVLFEAGMAYAKLGPERTVVCTFGDIRPMSDLGGFLSLRLDNSAAARRRLVARLKSAGCPVDDGGTDYLQPETGGDFDLKYEDLQLDKSVLDRGGFTDFVVDSSLSHTPNSQTLYRELCEHLKQGTKVDLKYNYLGTHCATQWLALSEDPTYGHSQLQKIISDHAEEIVERCDVRPDTLMDLVSLGPGDGIIDRSLILALQSRASFRCYYPLDISFDLLQRATAKITTTPWLFRQRPFGIKAIHGDFTDLKRYTPIYGYDRSINLFSMIGYSLGNYNEAELLSKLAEGMYPGDYLLLDARLHGIEGFRPGKRLGNEDKGKVLRNYNHHSNNRFALGPVETATLADPRQVAVELDVTTAFTAVPHAVNLMTYCTNLSTRFRHDFTPLRRDRLNLALTTQYSYDALVEWIDGLDFIDRVWNTRVETTALFVLRKSGGN